MQGRRPPLPPLPRGAALHPVNPRPCSHCGRVQACLLMVEFTIGRRRLYICPDCLESAGKVVPLEDDPEPAA